jgi:hypothetical protein
VQLTLPAGRCCLQPSLPAVNRQWSQVARGVVAGQLGPTAKVRLPACPLPAARPLPAHTSAALAAPSTPHPGVTQVSLQQQAGSFLICVYTKVRDPVLGF